MNRVLLQVSLFIFVTLVSCKKDSPHPIGAKNFTLTEVLVEGIEVQGFRLSNAPISPNVVLTFSEPLDRPSAQSSIQLSSPSAIIPVDCVFSNNDSTVSLHPKDPLDYFTVYDLQILAQLTAVSQKHFESNIRYKLITLIDQGDKFPRISDEELLDLIQQQTIKYFTDFAQPASGMARERNSSSDLVTVGGSGFGLMSLIAGVERGFIPRADGISRFNKIVGFLESADRFHGVWPHWINGATGKIIPFSTNDDGADLVETSFMMQGLITLREYLKLTPADTTGNDLINRIDQLWKAVEWDWFRHDDQNVLYWHWSPDKDWIMNFPIHGYDEALIVYVLAAGSPDHSIPNEVYTQGWALNGNIKNGKAFYGNTLPLGQDYGGPMFFAHYSFLGFDPHTQDTYLGTDYWTQNVNHTLINHDYCVANPRGYVGYGENCWGLTASDNPTGYNAQSPTNDNGTISPTAAISSIPYAPTLSMNAIHFFYYTMGDRLWGPYGFHDALNITSGWVADSYLAIDQGPIVVMIENYRTGLLWNLFMSAPEVQTAKTKLGFQ